MKNLLPKIVLPLVALAMLAFGVFHILKAQQELPKPPPPAQPSRSPFGSTIAGAGIVEARSENIAVGSALPGVVLQVYVPVEEVGKHVQAGDPLFRVDDRQLKAQLAFQQANLTAAQARLDKLDDMPRPEEIPPAEARVKAAEAAVWRTKDQFDRATKLLASNSIGAEEHNTKQRTYEEAVQQWQQANSELKLLKAGAWEPDKAIARAEIAQAQAQIEQIQTDIDRALVRAPVAGRVLQVNVRPGEYVGASPGQSLMVLGDNGKLHVRVDIDEADIPRFRPGVDAKAYLRGHDRLEVPLHFVRLEPMVVPKRSLTAENTELVDTRVLQVIYEAADDKQSLYVGQQVDVFLDAGGEVQSGPPASLARSGVER
jgi:multidrug resistance efflux pump